MELDKRFPVERFDEAAVPQSTVSSPLLGSHHDVMCAATLVWVILLLLLLLIIIIIMMIIIMISVADFDGDVGAPRVEATDHLGQSEYYIIYYNIVITLII